MQGQPECQRCIKGGRTCEGYARSSTPGSTSANPIKFVVYSGGTKSRSSSKTNTGTNTPSRTPSPPSRLSLVPDLGHAERRALSYFQERGAWELAGGVQPMFWLHGVLPVIHQEAAVKHALVALSTMHEHFTRSGRMSPNTQSNTLDFALNHYGRAIREVMDVNRNRGKHFFDCSLITCGLFAAFESLQGHYHSAFSHAVSGIKILAESQESPHPTTQTSDKDMYISRPELTRFFFSFWRQILEIGDWNFQGERPLLDPPTSTCPPIFNSVEEALSYVEYNMSGFFHFYEKAERVARQGIMTPEINLELMHKFDALTSSFAISEQAYQAMLTQQRHRNLESSPTGLILSIHRIFLNVYFNMVSQGNELEAFDAQLPSVRAAVELCEKFIALTSPFDTSDTMGRPAHDQTGPPSRSPSPPRLMPPSFSMGLGVVPILFVIATRCNDIPLRDKALHLLRICNRKEGFWDSQLSAVLAARTIEIKANAARQVGRLDLHPSAVNMKLEDIQYYPDNECVVSYSLMWTEADAESASTSVDLYPGDSSAALLPRPSQHPPPPPPPPPPPAGEPILRKRMFSERLAWGDQPSVVAVTDDENLDSLQYPSVMRNGLMSEEVRPPLQDWEKHGMVW
ncbi:hypothetical protein LTR84_001102 [Exophiala bonariae]|uniref:Zn(2)-C6 fungal-type domain-containing protein n=1 Tax=Exophiala bonariae TaxID=1690606 RepID=A0AAV9NSG6_9EURO|nr:hypothetical protein LTR84_001102 [Exophiala bonariae]